MLKHLTVIVLGIVLIGLTGCRLQTPEIKGVVLDAETKEPVEGAWVSATIGIESKTVAGDVGQVISLEQPHTRTGKDGRFVIPSKSFKKPLFPIGFGTKIDTVGIGVRTVDDKGGGIVLEGEELKEFLEKDVVDLTIYTKAIEKTEEEYFSHLQSLYNYCLTGRFGIEIPPVESGCDDWELNYAIIKHERYLERYPKTEENRSRYSIILEQLGLLYEKRGEYEKAIDSLKKAREIRFFRPQDLDFKVKELQQKLQQKQK